MSEFTSPASTTLRRAADADIAVIARFNSQLAKETEDKILDPRTTAQGVAGGMNHFPEVQYFVAAVDDVVIGQLMLTREWSDWRNGWMLWLQSVYIEEPFRSQGVFRNLLDFALTTVRKETNAVGLRLYVERENEAAIGVYRQMGFEDAGYHIFEIVPLDAKSG